MDDHALAAPDLELLNPSFIEQVGQPSLSGLRSRPQMGLAVERVEPAGRHRSPRQPAPEPVQSSAVGSNGLRGHPEGEHPLAAGAARVWLIVGHHHRHDRSRAARTSVQAKKRAHVGAVGGGDPQHGGGRRHRRLEAEFRLVVPQGQHRGMTGSRSLVDLGGGVGQDHPRGSA